MQKVTDMAKGNPGKMSPLVGRIMTFARSTAAPASNGH